VSDEARRAVALLVERWHGFTDLRALADIRVDRNGTAQALQGVLLAKAPESVRFEALSPFGQPLLLVSIHAGRLTAYNTATNEAMVGPATADTAAKLLSLPFDPDDLVGILAGRVVPPKDIRVAEIVPADDRGPSLALIGSNYRQRIWMDFTTGVVDRLDIVGGRYEVRIVYERDADGTPRGFEFSAADAYLTGRVHYRDVAIGRGIDAERFELVIPEGAKIQPLR
jgi:outer membrane lipoprotein-sorting protein